MLECVKSRGPQGFNAVGLVCRSSYREAGREAFCAEVGPEECYCHFAWHCCCSCCCSQYGGQGSVLGGINLFLTAPKRTKETHGFDARLCNPRRFVPLRAGRGRVRRASFPVTCVGAMRLPRRPFRRRWAQIFKLHRFEKFG